MISMTKTPGEVLDARLIGQTMTFEEVLGVMQIVHIHSTRDDWSKLERMFGVPVTRPAKQEPEPSEVEDIE